MKTKDKILQNALGVFNKEGISTTSTKKISKIIGISDGNLRYHYPTKEDIVIAILEQMKVELRDLKNTFSNDLIIPDKDFFKLFFTKSYYIIYKYRCIYLDQVWLNYHMLNYAEIFSVYVNEWRNNFLQTFKILRKHNILSNNYSDKQYEMLFEQLYIYSDSWIFYYVQNLNHSIEYYVDICMSILVPYWKEEVTLK